MVANEVDAAAVKAEHNATVAEVTRVARTMGLKFTAVTRYARVAPSRRSTLHLVGPGPASTTAFVTVNTRPDFICPHMAFDAKLQLFAGFTPFTASEWVLGKVGYVLPYGSSYEAFFAKKRLEQAAAAPPVQPAVGEKPVPVKRAASAKPCKVSKPAKTAKARKASKPARARGKGAPKRRAARNSKPT